MARIPEVPSKWPDGHPVAEGHEEDDDPSHHVWHQVCIWLEMVGVTCAGSAAFLGAFLMLSYASLISDKVPG